MRNTGRAVGVAATVQARQPGAWCVAVTETEFAALAGGKKLRWSLLKTAQQSTGSPP